ncbi:hypothetical protein GDO78_004005 [Eleutherodactylus coqui]|uniref:Uncharacterized protein n=1 Tax=Eleutherodactylus coqui TaxID=57060 RepID=A0A8J6K219_ELECQ|nr:hypothetical protein GDO78_004005 [Eleutherodactylus coqui]
MDPMFTSGVNGFYFKRHPQFCQFQSSNLARTSACSASSDLAVVNFALSKLGESTIWKERILATCKLVARHKSITGLLGFVAQQNPMRTFPYRFSV